MVNKGFVLLIVGTNQIKVALNKATLSRRWCQNWCQTRIGMFYFVLKSSENKEKPRQKPWFLWLVAPKKISPDFLKNPLVTRPFRTFFIIFLAPCNGLRSFLSNFIENRKRYLPNQVNFISPRVCSSVSKYPDSICWNGMCFFAKDEPSSISS